MWVEGVLGLEGWPRQPYLQQDILPDRLHGVERFVGPVSHFHDLSKGAPADDLADRRSGCRMESVAGLGPLWREGVNPP